MTSRGLLSCIVGFFVWFSADLPSESDIRASDLNCLPSASASISVFARVETPIGIASLAENVALGGVPFSAAGSGADGRGSEFEAWPQQIVCFPNRHDLIMQIETPYGGSYQYDFDGPNCIPWDVFPADEAILLNLLSVPTIGLTDSSTVTITIIDLAI